MTIKLALGIVPYPYMVHMYFNDRPSLRLLFNEDAILQSVQFVRGGGVGVRRGHETLDRQTKW